MACHDRSGEGRILMLIFGTAVLIGIAALLLWLTRDDKAQGAAIALIGAGGTHLIKETQLVLKTWIERPGGEMIQAGRDLKNGGTNA